MIRRSSKDNPKLDRAQEQIIEPYFTDNPPKFILTLASPGTGKTTTIAHLIEQLELRGKLNSMNILVLTFTKRTRGDLIDKLKNTKISQKRNDEIKIRVKNFHSLAFNMLFWRRIIDEDQLEEVISNIIKQLEGDFSEGDRKMLVKIAQKIIKDLLKRGLDQKEWDTEVEMLKQRSQNGVAETVMKYRDILQQRYKYLKQISYDYSLLKATELIKKGKPCHKINLNEIDLLIVDEFQDSNPAQIRMIEALIQRNKKNIKLLMVGDFDQNIYTWRGSDMNNIIDFLDRHPYEIRYLKNSYRLSQPVRDLSQRLITSVPRYNTLRNRFYTGYQLQALNKRSNEPQIIQFISEITQVRFVVDKIYQHHANGVKFGDITVLVRGFKNTTFIKRLKHQIVRRVKQVGQQEILMMSKLIKML